jgi:hypothetical protein
MSDITTYDHFTDDYLKRHRRVYQQILGSVSNLQELGNRLVKLAEQARDFRQGSAMKEAAQALLNIPLKPFQAIGLYHLGLYQHRNGDDAQRIFEQVADDAPTKYRAIAMLSLGATHNRKQDYAAELYWRVESSKIFPSLEALRSMAVIKSHEGYHKQALRDLENLQPLLKHAEPLSYYDHLNSLAVELGHAGRLEEARNICKAVLASPFAFAYREWQETAEDLRGANRSFVAVDPSPVAVNHSLSTASNVLFMPAPERQTSQNPAKLKRASRPARVFNLQNWKTKTAQQRESNNGNKQKTAEISDREMLLRIAELASTDDLPDEALREMVDALEKIVKAHKQKKDT